MSVVNILAILVLNVNLKLHKLKYGKSTMVVIIYTMRRVPMRREASMLRATSQTFFEKHIFIVCHTFHFKALQGFVAVQV